MLTPLIEQTVIPYLAQPGELALAADGDLLPAAAARLAAGAPALIVADADGRATGQVTAGDLLAAVADSPTGFDRRTVGDIKRPIGDWLAPNDPVLDAVHLMRLRRCDCLPVLEAGRAVAVVSVADLCAALARAVDDEFRRAEAHVFGTPEQPDEE